MSDVKQYLRKKYGLDEENSQQELRSAQQRSLQLQQDALVAEALGNAGRAFTGNERDDSLSKAAEKIGGLETGNVKDRVKQEKDEADLVESRQQADIRERLNDAASGRSQVQQRLLKKFYPDLKNEDLSGLPAADTGAILNPLNQALRNKMDVAQLKRQQEQDHKRELAQLESDSKQKAVVVKDPTQGQFSAGNFARRTEQAEEVLNKLADKGYNRASVMERLQGVLPAELQSSNRQMQDQAERNFVNAILRKESGAAISPAEFANAEKQYFPRSGDSKEVMEQKRLNRLQAIAALKAEAGPALDRIPEVSANVSNASQGGLDPNAARAELLRRRGK